MAGKQKKEQPKSAELTSDKIKKGIIKLKRRIKELGEFDIETIQERWDPKTEALTTKINDTISEIFGYGTIEYQKYYIYTLDTLPLIMGSGEDPIYKVREGYKKGIESAIVKLSSFIEILQEKIEDVSQPADADDNVKAYDFWTDIHPKITAISKSRFDTPQYADAVESALKEINSCVKGIVRKKTGKELDGASLMKTAFSPNNPIIVLDDLSTETGKNIQQGYMEIFAGAMTGIRNPKAHNNIHITENRAKHFIYLASLLMNKIDERI